MVPDRIEIVPALDLSERLCERWEMIRRGNRNLDSPFFSSEFTRSVGMFCGDSRVAVLRCGEEVTGFLPFQSRGRTAFPIGKRINDSHGVITTPGTSIDWDPLLAAMKVKRFAYRGLVEPIDADAFHFGYERNYVADFRKVPAGFSDYGQWLEEKRETIRKQKRKTRKLEKLHGPLRLEFDSVDPEGFRRIIEWKRRRYQAVKTFDVFSVRWIEGLLEHLHRKGERLKGCLSILYAGDQVVSSHLGMREGRVLHYWFPAFDPAFSFASPGTALFLAICREAASRGIDLIDFGYGEQPYKTKLSNQENRVPFGAICQSRTDWRVCQSACCLTRGIKALGVIKPARDTLVKLVPDYGRKNYC